LFSNSSVQIECVMPRSHLERMRVVVHRIDAPRVAAAVVMRVPDTVQQRIAHLHVRRRHIDLRAQRARAIGSSPAFIRRSRARLSSTVRSRNGLGRPGSLSVPRYSLIWSSSRSHTYACLDHQPLGQLVHLAEVVRREQDLCRREPQPPHVALDRIDVLHVLLRRVSYRR